MNRALLAVMLLLAAGCRGSLEERLDALTRGRDVAIVYRELDSGRGLARREHVVFHAASTMKLAVLVALHADPALDLDAPVPVENRFRSIVDGSEFSLDRSDDEDPWTYEQVGKSVPLRTLMERMIVRSSNLATNLLIARADPARVTSLCRSLGARETVVLRGVEDAKAHERGLDNVTSAADLALLLEAIGAGRVRGARAMEDVLARQELNEGIPRGLPAGTRVAHKTGAITKIYHDAALVLPAGEKGYVLVVLTRGFADESEAADLVAQISHIAWEERVR